MTGTTLGILGCTVNGASDYGTGNPGGPILASCASKVSGIWAQAACTWNTYVSFGNPTPVPMATNICKKYYNAGLSGWPNNVPSNVAQLAAVGCQFLLCMQPGVSADGASYVMTAAERTNFANNIAYLQRGGVIFDVTICQEPNRQACFPTAASYATYIAYYGPVAANPAAYFNIGGTAPQPVNIVYNPAYGVDQATAISYYPGDGPGYSHFALCADWYGNSSWKSGVTIDAMAAVADDAGKPFGIGEFGSDNGNSAPLSGSDFTNFCAYLSGYFGYAPPGTVIPLGPTGTTQVLTNGGRLYQGKQNYAIMYFNSNNRPAVADCVVGTGTVPSSDIKIPGLQNLYNALTNPGNTSVLLGHGTIAATVHVQVPGAASLAGHGAMIPSVFGFYSAAIATAGTLSATATQTVHAAAALDASTSLSDLAVQKAPAELDGQSTLAAAVSSVFSASAELAGASAAIGSSQSYIPGASALTGLGAISGSIIQQAVSGLPAAGAAVSAATQGAGAPLAGAGAAATRSTVRAVASLAGSGGASGNVTYSAGAIIPGAGNIAAGCTLGAFAELDAGGQLSPPAMLRAGSLMAGAGLASAAGFFAGISSLAGITSVSDKSATLAGAQLSGSGAIASASILYGIIQLAANGNAGALAVLGAFAQASGTGTMKTSFDIPAAAALAGQGNIDVLFIQSVTAGLAGAGDIDPSPETIGIRGLAHPLYGWGTVKAIPKVIRPHPWWWWIWPPDWIEEL